MTELWLKFIDEYGETRRVSVEKAEFIVGRHSDNDLTIADNKLSRQHIKIERFADIFVVSDCGSSNGTTLNGIDLIDPAQLKDGDRLCLGGNLEIAVEGANSAAGENDFAENADAAAAGESESSSSVSSAADASSPAAGTKSVSASNSSAGSIPTIFYFLAPAFVLIALVLGGGLFFAFSGKEKKTVVRRDSDFTYSNSDLEDPQKSNKNKNSSKTPEPTPSSSPLNAGNNQISDPLNAQTPVAVSSEIDKVKQNSASFMRRIAQNDQNPFLTQEQANLVNEKIKSMKNSSSLIENIKAVKKDSAQFESLATSQNLKPQFLAAAALTNLGTGRGNPTETAKEMLPVLSELKVKLDNKLADDNLLIIAAFDLGKAGKYGSLSGKIEALAKTSTNVSPRQIRTIWFLKERGKITDAEFEFALRFLAIGTIMQNPKDFDVNAEAVIF